MSRFLLLLLLALPAGAKPVTPSDTDRLTPGEIAVPPTVRFTRVSGHFYSFAALERASSIYLWGHGWADADTPRLPRVAGALKLSPPPKTRFSDIATGLCKVLARSSDGRLFGFGANMHGTLGDGSETDRFRFVPIHAPKKVRFDLVRAGFFHTLALSSDHRLYAWGASIFGQLGNGAQTEHHLPTPVQAPASLRFTDAVAGDNHNVAVTSAGQVYAWGSNDRWLLDGSYPELGNQLKPVPIPFPPEVEVVHVAAGYGHSLALTREGDVYAWGDNRQGQLGQGNDDVHSSPVLVHLPRTAQIAAVAAGFAHNLALGRQGELYAWGENRFGQLGDGTRELRAAPVRIATPPGIRFTQITAGNHYSLALTSSGRLYTWGRRLDLDTPSTPPTP